MNEPIVAISTSLGVGAISIIRISGEEIVSKINKVFKGTDLTKVASHTIHYGHIIYKEEIIDEVLVTIMKAPKTFTKEDVIEINCHGGIAPTKKVLEIILSLGIRMALPGEFTKRAYLNGRIDLIEAENIMDLINTKSESARKLAINAVNGNITNLIVKLREKLLNVIANIEVNIDYPEYEDIEEMTLSLLKDNLKEIEKELINLVKESSNSKIIKDGINVAIIGRPNVGKSSILNKLINEEKAIVTNTPGTTRDIVEGSITIDGFIVNFIDTAGIRETSNLIEKLGVNKSLSMIENVDLIILVLNNNEALEKDDIEIIERLKNKNVITVINKIDLVQKIDISSMNLTNIVYCNTLSFDGIKTLKDKIKELFNLDLINNGDFNYLTNTRQIAKANEALELLNDIKVSILNNQVLDIIEIDIKKIWDLLGEIIGISYDEELLDALFSKFCLGK
ncbi:MAG: tRNA uridine-5-carboxymethylaminomethyl(34) synthesis GTPase MnmE [Bacilli bacterium]